MGMSSSGGPRGDPPIPSAVAFVHRDVNAVGDDAVNSGYVFIGPPNHLHARHTLAWLIHHGFSVRLEYFNDLEGARARYPNVPSDIGPDVLSQGAAIIAANPSILDGAFTPRAKASMAPGVPLFSPFSASGPLRSVTSVDGGGGAPSNRIIPSNLDNTAFQQSPNPSNNMGTNIIYNNPTSIMSPVINSTTRVIPPTMDINNNINNNIIIGSSTPTNPASLPAQPPLPSTTSAVGGINVELGRGQRASSAVDPPTMDGLSLMGMPSMLGGGSSYPHSPVHQEV